MHVLSEITFDAERFGEPSEALVKSLGDQLVPEPACSLVAVYQSHELREGLSVTVESGELPEPAAAHMDDCTGCQRRAVGQAGLN